LRECVNGAGPRICVFELSGTIRLTSNLTISNPEITIAGQTAPSPGILLRGAALAVRASDVLVQHLAIRAGDDPDGPAYGVRDTLKIETPDPIQNAVIDHCSISWGLDENVSTYKAWDNVTISNSIISEALDSSLHEKGAHSYGGLVSSNTNSSRISLVGNLFASNSARNPLTNATRFIFINNVVYNPRKAAVMLYNTAGITSDNSIVGNVFIDGPSTYSTALPIRLVGSSSGNGTHEFLSGSRLYLADNLASSFTGDIKSIIYNQTSLNLDGLKLFSAPAWPAGLKVLPTNGDTVLNYVLKNAGSRPGERNSVDARVVADVKKGTGRIINCVANDGSDRCAANAGGWPSMAKNTRKLTLPADPNGDDNGNGYTNMEEWLHAMAAEVEGRASSGQPFESVPPNPPTLQN
jgi:hypothetical protein